jgi:hypothetical protein
MEEKTLTLEKKDQLTLIVLHMAYACFSFPLINYSLLLNERIAAHPD